MCIFSVDRTLEPGFALEKSKTDPVECDERMNVLCITQTSIFPEKMLLFLGLTSRRNCGVFSGQCRGLTSDVNSQSSNRRLNEEDVHAPTQLEIRKGKVIMRQHSWYSKALTTQSVAATFS
jgi:hypothetical protein